MSFCLYEGYLHVVIFPKYGMAKRMCRFGEMDFHDHLSWYPFILPNGTQFPIRIIHFPILVVDQTMVDRIIGWSMSSPTPLVYIHILIII